MDLSLKEFLTTGELGSLRLGLHYTEVIELIGEPEDYGIHKKTGLFKYDNLELGFYKKILGGFYLYYDKWSVKSRIINFTDFEPDGTTTLDVFTTWLNDQGIPNFIDKQVTYDEQTALRIAMGVGIYFRGTLLDSIQYSEPKIPIKSKAKK